jgi:hypothetical protein
VELGHRLSALIEPHAIAAIAFSLIKGMVGRAKQFLADQLGMACSV